MKCLISITKLSNLTLLYFFLLFLFKIILNLMKNEIKKNLFTDDDNYKFIIVILMYISESLSIIYFIIRYFMTKKNKKRKNNKIIENKELEKTITFYLNNNQHNFYSFFSFISSDYKSVFIIFLIALCDFITTMFLINYAVDFYGVSGITGLLLFKILFKYQIYNHHILSIIILAISSLAQIIISFFDQTNSDKNKNNFYKTFFEIIYNICNGLFLILIKYLIDIKHIETLIILFLHGIFGLLFSIIYYLILKYNETLIYIKNFFSLNMLDYLFLIFFIICVSFYNVLIYLLSENTPSIYNLFIYSMTVYFSHFILNGIKDHVKSLLLIITFILNIINIFAMLIFVEFFVLNFCGFNYNCRVNIQNREIEEKKVIQMKEI